MIPILKKKTVIFFLLAESLFATAGIPFASAQVSSMNGRFLADFDKGCADFTISLTETDTFPPETVKQYDFGVIDSLYGFGPGEPISYTYMEPGSYELIQVIGRDDVFKTDTLLVIVYEPVLPAFRVFTCEDNAVEITIDDRNYDRYRIYYTQTDSQEIAAGESPVPFSYSLGSHQVGVKGIIPGGKDNCPAFFQNFSTITTLVPAALNSVRVARKDKLYGKVVLDYALAPDIVYQLEFARDIPAGFSAVDYISGNQVSVDSLDTESRANIFRIAAFDKCKNNFIYSDTLSSIALSVTAENGQNKIEWISSPAGFSEYNIVRDNQPYNTLPSKNVSYFIDNSVQCFVRYCYSLSYTTTLGSSSFSDTVCVEATSVYFPPAIRNTTTSAGDTGYELSWIPPEGIGIKEFFIQRKIDTDIFATIDTTFSASASDTAVNNASASFCYRISYLDQCDNRSNLGYESCSIHLVLADASRLTWNDYTGWRNGVKNYILEIFNENKVLQNQIDMGTENSFQIRDFYQDQINYYRISARSNDADPYIAYSNFIYKLINSVLNVPNAFTPDGDGLNDVFNVSGTGMKEYKIKVFTRHGNLLFESNDQETGWDGSYMGNEAPEDTYIFNIIAEDFLGREFKLKGAIVLLRH